MEAIVNIHLGKGFKEKAGLELPVRKQSFPFSIFPFPRWQPLTPMDSERAIRDSHPRWKKIAAAPPLALPRSLLRMSAVAGTAALAMAAKYSTNAIDFVVRPRKKLLLLLLASAGLGGRSCSYAGRAVCDLGACPKRNWPQCKYIGGGCGCVISRVFRLATHDDKWSVNMAWLPQFHSNTCRVTQIFEFEIFTRRSQRQLGMRSKSNFFFSHFSTL